MLTAIGVIGWVVLMACCTGCVRGPRAQHGGAVMTTLGGGSGLPTTTSLGAPENAQTPSTTTLERSTTRTFVPPASAGALTAGPPDSTGSPQWTVAAGAAPRASGTPFAAEPTGWPPFQETITERATTQLGTSQDLAGILKTWGALGVAHYKALLWGLLLGVAAWMAWRREWPLIAVCLGVGAVLALLIAWWCGPVAVLAAGLIYAARALTLSQLPLPRP